MLELSAALLVATCVGLQAPEPVAIAWDSPGPDHHASMPLGNGDVGVNAWWEASGDLLLLISKTDSWEDNARLAKVGLVRLRLEPPPAPGEPFRQVLATASATIETTWGDASWRVWVDANHPSVIVEVSGGTPRALVASIEPWRTSPERLAAPEIGDPAFDPDAPGKTTLEVMVRPDEFLPESSGLVGWFHHNATSVGYPETMALQDLEGFGQADPILHRTFGGAILHAGARASESEARVAPAVAHRLEIPVLTRHPAAPGEWTSAMRSLAARLSSMPAGERRRAHEAWWRAFWDRSYVVVRDAHGSGTRAPMTTPSTHPVRIGLDQHGGNVFPGEIARASVYAGALDDATIQSLAATRDDPAPIDLAPLVRGQAMGTIEGSHDLVHSGSFTCEAWVLVPNEGIGPGGGRIIDKTTPGGTDGLLFDTYPGRGLRLMTAARTVIARDVLEPGAWSHVAAVCDAGTGEVRLYVNARLVGRERVDRASEGESVTRAYALQRYMTACAGRGAFPIKFNGSIFTVARPSAPGGHDYRRWGAGYWWQNTRWAYAPLCRSGDFDLLGPLFRMYAGEHLALAKFRTRRYWGHDGAYLNECAYFWGAAFNESYGWVPRASGARETEFNLSRWHRWEFQGGLELAWMMLDYAEHTRDEAFTRDTLVPFAREVLAFYDRHYADDEHGTMVIAPSQALETWWECTNPAPELAGIAGVCERLLALGPALAGEDRALVERLIARVAPLPTTTDERGTRLAPAAAFAHKSNEEHPELYAVFPYRRFGVGRPDLELARRTFATRDDRRMAGWHQDDLFAAYLGLTDEARAGVVSRSRSWDPTQRFPAFWGPNYDWTPDQCHGGVLMTTLQSMLVQSDDRAIHLLPAWPADWDADFRLHAPDRTVLEGTVRAGRLETLAVTPESRRADVVLHVR